MKVLSSINFRSTRTTRWSRGGALKRFGRAAADRMGLEKSMIKWLMSLFRLKREEPQTIEPTQCHWVFHEDGTFTEIHCIRDKEVNKP